MTAYWKSILAFVSLIVTNVAIALVQSGQAWPTDGKGWGVFAITTVLGTWLVYQGPRNKTVGDA